MLFRTSDGCQHVSIRRALSNLQALVSRTADLDVGIRPSVNSFTRFLVCISRLASHLRVVRCASGLYIRRAFAAAIRSFDRLLWERPRLGSEVHSNFADPQYGRFFGNYDRKFLFDFDFLF